MTDEDPDGSQRRSEAESRYRAAQQELQELRRKMDTIKQEVADEVDRRWASMWRNDGLFDLKVSARLSAHQEYQSLLGRVRDVEQVEAGLAEELGVGKDEPA